MIQDTSTASRQQRRAAERAKAKRDMRAAREAERRNKRRTIREARLETAKARVS